MSDKLNIANEMRAFDSKDRQFYRELTDEERKKFSNYLMIRWGSSVAGATELQHYYLVSTNERLNKHFFAVNRHPKLQWLMATSVSPGFGSQRHQWIAPKKKEKGTSEVKKALLERYPNAKLDEIELMATWTTAADIREWQRNQGNEVK